VLAGEGLSTEQVERIEQAVARERARCGVDFSVFVGPLPEGRDSALALHSRLGTASDTAVLVAVDPGARATEIVTGAQARRWVDDRACALAALAMVSSLSAGDLVGGVTRGLTTLGDQARHPNPLHADLPED